MLCFLKALSIILYFAVFLLSCLIIILVKCHLNVSNKKVKSIAFFHPYANDGGGGERVLWCAIKALQNKFKEKQYIIYTGDKVSATTILDNVYKNFGIELNLSQISIIHLKYRAIVEPKLYPAFTLLGQSLGSIILGLEALFRCTPDILIDTAGYAFILPFFKYFGSIYVGCYVHYPVISSDMLKRVERREKQFNNAEFLSKYKVLSQAKLLYYKFFSKIYGIMGRSSDFIFVNSTWTKNHILELWNKSSLTYILYPPCDTKEFGQISNICENLYNTKIIDLVSIGQFRPEKNHSKQIQIFKILSERCKIHPNLKHFKINLQLIGSCRNDDDKQRIRTLEKLCKDLNVANLVKFNLNITFDEVKVQMAKSMVGLHTMSDEHFGIGIVECMAAGVIMIANNSGGPKLDILTPYNGHCVGYLADSDEDYAQKIIEIIEMDPSERQNIRENAKKSVDAKFSTQIFENKFLDVMTPFVRRGDKEQ